MMSRDSVSGHEKIAEAHKIKFLRVKSHKGLKEQMRKALNAPGPFICELMMDPTRCRCRIPAKKGADGKRIFTPLEDMYPYLDPPNSNRTS